MSSASVWPDLSSASLRVSETVRTAMLTGRNGRVSSILGMATSIRDEFAVECHIGRPLSASKRVEIRRRLVETHAVDPVIRQDAQGIDPRLLPRNAFEEEQRIVTHRGLRR